MTESISRTERTLSRYEDVVWDVTSSALSYYLVTATSRGRTEIAYDSAFASQGLNFSVSLAAITDGFRLTFSRIGGWEQQTEVRVVAVDATGTVAEASQFWDVEDA